MGQRRCKRKLEAHNNSSTSSSSSSNSGRMWLVLAALVFGCAGAARGPLTPCGQARDGEALLGALLPLHRGAGCGAASLRGAQLEAALRAALDRVNRDLRREGISISCRILDTCSRPDEAVKAAMRALVASDQTCLSPPLFLGLIGPEDPESLDAALKVTGVFETVHVVPWGESQGDGVLHVAKLDPEERAQSVMLLVRRLRWPSFLLVHGDDVASEDVAGEVSRLADQDPDVCAQRRVLSLAEDTRGDSDVAWAISKDSSGGVVLIAESAERGAQLLSRLAPLPRTGPGGEVHVLLAVRRAEAGSLQDLGALKGVAITLLQEVSPAALVPGTQRALLSDSPLWQSLGEPDGAAGLDQASQDASVGALAVGVQLLGAALRAAHRIKCPTPAPPGGDGADSAPPAVFCPALHAMAPDEWKSILERVTAFSDSAATKGAATKLRFGMSLRTAARVLVKRSQSEYFEKAGLLVGGKDLQLESTRFSFPALRPGVDEDCGAAQRSPASSSSSSSSSSQGTRSTAATTSTPQRTKAVNRVTLERHPRTTPAPSSGFGADWSWILGGGADGPDGDFWTMLYMLLGAAAVMLFVFLCCFYIVYNNFRVKGNKAQDNESISPPVSRAASRRSSGSS